MEKDSIFKKIIKIIFYFIFINIMVFIIVISKQTIGRPYPLAKINMAIAGTLHVCYEIPLTKVFGPYNILTKPVYKARDYFYNKGLKYLPENDAESL